MLIYENILLNESFMIENHPSVALVQVLSLCFYPFF